jgi:hypothetical protein
MRRIAVVRFLALTVAVMFAVAGPLAPLAQAQQPAQPGQPAQPDLFQETLKAQRASDTSQGYYDAGAIAVNTVLVPGRALTCVSGGAVAVVFLFLTFGTAYKFASQIVNEGCGGKWVVKGDDLRPEAAASMGTEKMEPR